MKTQNSFSATICPNTMAGRLRTACVVRLLPLLLLLALPAVVQAQDYTYTTNNGAITITGYTGLGGDVTIPDTINGLPVTSIGNTAFFSCTNPTSITIGTNVTSIGTYAFIQNPQAAITVITAITVNMNNPVYSSVDGVLFNKSRTTLIICPGGKTGSYAVPDSVTKIGINAFYQCTSLTSVTLPDSVISIEETAFRWCFSLTNVTIPDSVTNIGNFAFYLCTSLTNVTIGNHVTSIGTGVFVDCTSLASITIPDSVTSIGDSAFEGCTNLANVTIGNGVISIGSQAFDDCTSLTNITIGSSVSSISYLAFYYCPNLTGIYFKGNAPSLDWSVFTYATNATVYYLPGTTNWFSPFGGRPAVLWNPQAQTSGVNFGVRTNRFGFDITGTTNIPIVLEACTNLANPTWISLQSCILTNGSLYFSDPDWTNYPGRFYRFRSP